MDGEIQVRRNAYRTFAPGTLFNISSWRWELLSCVPEPDGRGNVAIIDTPSRGRALVTGLTGITAADKGRFLVISGSGTAANNHYHQIEEYISATSVKIDARTFAVAADAGPLTWSIVDPMLDSWSESGNILNAYRLWWCAEGPAILKVPITQKPYGGTSDALRGENIKQATSTWAATPGQALRTTSWAPSSTARGSSSPRTSCSSAALLEVRAVRCVSVQRAEPVREMRSLFLLRRLPDPPFRSIRTWGTQGALRRCCLTEGSRRSCPLYLVEAPLRSRRTTTSGPGEQSPQRSSSGTPRTLWLPYPDGGTLDPPLGVVVYEWT